MTRFAGPWRCFHCDQVFAHRKVARAHFGDDRDAIPTCVVERHPLVRQLRRQLRALEPLRTLAFRLYLGIGRVDKVCLGGRCPARSKR